MTLQLLGGLALLSALLGLVDIIVDDPSSGRYARRNVEVFEARPEARINIPVGSPFAKRGLKVYVEGMSRVWCIFNLRDKTFNGIPYIEAELREENCSSIRFIQSSAFLPSEERGPCSFRPHSNLGCTKITLSDRDTQAASLMLHLEFDTAEVEGLERTNAFSVIGGVWGALKEVWRICAKAATFDHSYLNFFPMSYIRDIWSIVLVCILLWAFGRIGLDTISFLRGR